MIQQLVQRQEQIHMIHTMYIPGTNVLRSMYNIYARYWSILRIICNIRRLQWRVWWFRTTEGSCTYLQLSINLLYTWYTHKSTLVHSINSSQCLTRYVGRSSANVRKVVRAFRHPSPRCKKARRRRFTAVISTGSSALFSYYHIYIFTY